MTGSIAFGGRVLLAGFGSVGRGSLPLLLSLLGLRAQQIQVVSADDDGAEVARAHGVPFKVQPLRAGTFADVLAQHLGAGDLLLNATVDVCSVDLIEWCLSHGVHYVDATLDPWDGAQGDASVAPALRSHYAYREQALALRARFPGAATCVVTHGANPGMVSHFVKRALQHLGERAGLATPADASRSAWAALARRLDIRAIHVAERDGQTTSRVRQPGEFLNTWSCTALCHEAWQPAELGWGTHETELPADGRHFGFGSGAAIYLDRPGLTTRMRSWVPKHGAYEGWLISHCEAISIADFLTVHEDGRPVYRPTCHYVYRPCEAASQSLQVLLARGTRLLPRQKVLRDEITGGEDELGVLLMGAHGAYWYGSRLDVAQARRLAPENNATTLQVNISYVAAAAWALQNPARGLVEPEEMDHEVVIEFAAPYLGQLVGAHTDWTPATASGRAASPGDDPWQFRHFRIG